MPALLEFVPGRTRQLVALPCIRLIICLVLGVFLNTSLKRATLKARANRFCKKLLPRVLSSYFDSFLPLSAEDVFLFLAFLFPNFNQLEHKLMFFELFEPNDNRYR